MLSVPEKKKDVLEVYYLCLSLGFEGKYKLYSPEERTVTSDNLGRTLRRTRLRAFGGLSPHGRRTDAGTDARRRIGRVPFPLWLPGAICGAVAFFVWVVLYSINASEFGRLMDALKP